MRALKMMAVAFAALMTVAVAPAGAAHKEKGTTYYTADLNPLNGSGVDGHVEIQVKGNRLDVTVIVTGAEPGQVHPQHIHGFDGNDQDATCPPPEAADDIEDDGLISIEEGAPFYGPVQLSLEPFPIAAADGTYSFQETFKITNANKDFTVQDARDLVDEEIVIHGMTVMGEYWPTLPIACGAIVAQPQP